MGFIGLGGFPSMSLSFHHAAMNFFIAVLKALSVSGSITKRLPINLINPINPIKPFNPMNRVNPQPY